MVAGNKDKKLKVAEKGEEDNNQINEELVLSIEKLQEIQDDLEKINEEASDKVLEVEQKYNEIRKPVYDKRNKIIKSIPGFWLTAFLSHPALGTLLSEEDQKIFKFLSSLQVEDSKDVKSGYSITSEQQRLLLHRSAGKRAWVFKMESVMKIKGRRGFWLMRASLAGLVALNLKA